MKAYSHAVRGQDGGSNSKEEIFRSGYPPLNRTVSRNCTIVDLKGNIVAWLLPDLLSERMQNIAWESLHHLSPAFEHNHPQTTAPWRSNEQYYMNPELCTTFPRGAVNLSPAWHEQAKDHIPDNCQRWVRSSQDIAAIMSAVLSVVQPELYRLNRECLVRLSQREGLRTFISAWGFAFNAVSVISNRSSPAHRDRKSGATEFRVLFRE
ncbi:hypothetical protein BC826DRAFT_1141459 [Russula brevipes]|nr:hypothetical protein BC826DRAFT_1141459 [Russula brevipes]